MYTKVNFGHDLRLILQKTSDPYEIGKWAFSTYWENISNLEHGVRSISLALSTMEDGPEFAYSYEELLQIANDLIDGKDVKL